MELEDVASLRVVDLKKELKKRGLVQSGRKAELAERLREYLAANNNPQPTSKKRKGEECEEVPRKKARRAPEKVTQLVAAQSDDGKTPQQRRLEARNRRKVEGKKDTPTRKSRRRTICSPAPRKEKLIREASKVKARALSRRRTISSPAPRAAMSSDDESEDSTNDEAAVHDKVERVEDSAQCAAKDVAAGQEGDEEEGIKEPMSTTEETEAIVLPVAEEIVDEVAEEAEAIEEMEHASVEETEETEIMQHVVANDEVPEVKEEIEGEPVEVQCSAGVEEPEVEEPEVEEPEVEDDTAVSVGEQGVVAAEAEVEEPEAEEPEVEEPEVEAGVEDAAVDVADEEAGVEDHPEVEEELTEVEEEEPEVGESTEEEEAEPEVDECTEEEEVEGATDECTEGRHELLPMEIAHEQNSHAGDHIPPRAQGDKKNGGLFFGAPCGFGTKRTPQKRTSPLVKKLGSADRSRTRKRTTLKVSSQQLKRARVFEQKKESLMLAVEERKASNAPQHTEDEKAQIMEDSIEESKARREEEAELRRLQVQNELASEMQQRMIELSGRSFRPSPSKSPRSPRQPLREKSNTPLGGLDSPAKSLSLSFDVFDESSDEPLLFSPSHAIQAVVGAVGFMFR